MISVALAGDQEYFRVQLVNMLSCLPECIIVLQAENGIDLLQKLNELKKLPDVIIVDVEMAVMDGISFTNYFKSKSDDAKVVGVSFHSDSRIVKEMFEAGAHGYILNESLSCGTVREMLASVRMGCIYLDDKLDTIPLTEVINSVQESKNFTDRILLSEREKAFLRLVTSDISYEKISEVMNVGKLSIYNYQKSLKEKLNIGSRQGLMLYAIRNGISKVLRLR